MYNKQNGSKNTGNEIWAGWFIKHTNHQLSMTMLDDYGAVPMGRRALTSSSYELADC